MAVVVAASPYLRNYLLPKLCRAGLSVEVLLRALPRRGNALPKDSLFLYDIIPSISHPWLKTGNHIAITNTDSPPRPQNLTLLKIPQPLDIIIPFIIGKTTNTSSQTIPQDGHDLSLGFLKLATYENQRFLLYKGKIMELTSPEYKFLRILITNWRKGNFMFPHKFLQKSLGYTYSTVRTTLTYLRRKLAPLGFEIRSTYGVGYWISPSSDILALLHNSQGAL